MIKLVVNKRGKLTLAAIIVLLLVFTTIILGSSNRDFTIMLNNPTGVSVFEVYEEELNLYFENNNSFKIFLSKTNENKKLDMIRITGLVIDDPSLEEKDVKIYLKDKNEKRYSLYEGNEEEDYVLSKWNLFTITGLAIDKSNEKKDKKEKTEKTEKTEKEDSAEGDKSVDESVNEGTEEDESVEGSTEGDEEVDESNKKEDKEKDKDGKQEDSGDEGEGETTDAMSEKTKKKVKFFKKDYEKKDKLIGEIILDFLNEQEDSSSGSSTRQEPEKDPEIEIYAEIGEELIVEEAEIASKKLESGVEEFEEYLIISEGINLSEFEIVVEVDGAEVIIENLSFIFE